MKTYTTTKSMSGSLKTTKILVGTKRAFEKPLYKLDRYSSVKSLSDILTSQGKVTGDMFDDYILDLMKLK